MYRPDDADLLRTVADFLAGIAPGLSSEARYQALVCQHILAMLARAAELRPPEDHTPARVLAAEIRAGAHDAHWETLLARLLEDATARLALIKPDHIAPSTTP